MCKFRGALQNLKLTCVTRVTQCVTHAQSHSIHNVGKEMTRKETD